MNKKIISILMVVLLASITLTFQSCEEKEKKGTFTLTIPSITFDTNPLIINNEVLILDTSVSTAILQKLNSEGLGLDKVTSITLKECKMKLNTVGSTFDSFEYGVANMKGGSLPLQKFAFKAPIPHTGLTEITFDSQYAELLDYLKLDNIEVELITYPNVIITTKSCG